MVGQGPRRSTEAEHGAFLTDRRLSFRSCFPFVSCNPLFLSFSLSLSLSLSPRKNQSRGGIIPRIKEGDLDLRWIRLTSFVSLCTWEVQRVLILHCNVWGAAESNLLLQNRASAATRRSREPIPI